MTEKPEDGSDFIVTGDKDKLQPKEAEEEKKEEVKANSHVFPGFGFFWKWWNIQVKATNGDNKEEAIDVQDDDIMEVDDIICASSNNQGENMFLCRLCRMPTVQETTRGREGRMEVSLLPRNPGDTNFLKPCSLRS